jgi:hypothetical protein
VPRENQSLLDAFVQWVKTATPDQLWLFAEALEVDIEDLEADDFFGTEGINKRFA